MIKYFVMMESNSYNEEGFGIGDTLEEAITDLEETGLSVEFDKCSFFKGEQISVKREFVEEVKND